MLPLALWLTTSFGSSVYSLLLGVSSLSSLYSFAGIAGGEDLAGGGDPDPMSATSAGNTPGSDGQSTPVTYASKVGAGRRRFPNRPQGFGPLPAAPSSNPQTPPIHTCYCVLDEPLVGKLSWPLIAKSLHQSDDRFIGEIQGVQFPFNNRVCEVQFRNPIATEHLLTQGLFVAGNIQRTLQFQPTPTPTINVSVQGAPLEMPIEDFKDILKDHGPIVGAFDVKRKMVENATPLLIRDGTRVIQFARIEIPIPRRIRIADRDCTVIYNNQSQHHKEYEKEQERLSA